MDLQLNLLNGDIITGDFIGLEPNGNLKIRTEYSPEVTIDVNYVTNNLSGSRLVYRAFMDWFDRNKNNYPPLRHWSDVRYSDDYGDVEIYFKSTGFPPRSTMMAVQAAMKPFGEVYLDMGVGYTHYSDEYSFTIRLRENYLNWY